MKFLRGFIPNLTIALNVAMMIVLYLNSRNPMMGFLIGTPFLVLAMLTCILSMMTAVIVYADWRKRGNRRKHPQKTREKVSNSPCNSQDDML